MFGENLDLILNKTFVCFMPLWTNLHPCWHDILMPMFLLQTLLRIHHAYALEYDKPWLIEHYIQIFNMPMFSRWLQYVAHLHFYEILETNMVFFVDSKYVIFNKNI